MNTHWHVSAENILIYGLSAIVVIWGIRLVAGVLVHQTGPLETVGKSLGAVVNFS